MDSGQPTKHARVKDNSRSCNRLCGILVRSILPITPQTSDALLLAD